MPRRDAFSVLRGWNSASQDTDPAASKAAAPPDEIPSIKPLDFIPTAQPRKKRDRQWEKAHQGQVTTYRGIPAEMHQAMLQLADSLGVPVDEIARAFLEYSLAQHTAGKLPIYPHPKAQRMTLYPEGVSAADKQPKGWLQDAFALKQPGKKTKKSSQPKRWELRVSYRLPISLKGAVKELAEAHTVGVGELAFFLFQHAMTGFEKGELRLTAHPKISGNTLF